jgi:hypothetical protein
MAITTIHITHGQGLHTMDMDIHLGVLPIMEDGDIPTLSLLSRVINTVRLMESVDPAVAS